MKLNLLFKYTIVIAFLCFLSTNNVSAQSLVVKKHLTLYDLSSIQLRIKSKFTNNLIIHRNNSTLNKSIKSNYNPDPPDLTLFSNIGKNFINSFKGDNLYLHLAGIASTIVLVNGNVDYHVEHYFNQNPQFGQAASPIIRVGTLFPFIVGGSLYALGKINSNNETLGASFAVLQSSLLAFLYNSFLKAITGRMHPDWKHYSDMKDLSKTFRFGFMRGGIFWGWPSGHTSSMMAVISALTSFYPHKTWLKIAGYSMAAYMIYGVSSFHRGGMHWFSDAVAAALMSYAIGSTVGKYYRSLFNGTNTAQNSNNSLQVEPNPIGITLSFNF